MWNSMSVVRVSHKEPVADRFLLKPFMGILTKMRQRFRNAADLEMNYFSLTSFASNKG